MTNDQIQLQKIEAERNIADKDREQKETDSKRRLAGTVGSSAVKAVSSIIGAAAKAANDPAWYDLDKDLTNGACTSDQAVELGSPMNLGSKDSVPGIMVLRYVPTLSVNTADYFNQCANALYNKITGNKSVTSFQATDLMIYLTAMDQVYSFINLAKRMLKIKLLTKGSATNKYIGGALNVYVGGNVPSGAIAQYRSQLNMEIQRANAFYMPAIIPYFARHSQMNANIYKDSQYSKYSQLYAFVPSGHFSYNDVKGRLEYVTPSADVPTSPMLQIGYVLTELGKLLDALQGSSSISNINSKMEDYITKHSEFPVINIKYLAENEVQEFVYSEEILNQITNATVNGQLLDAVATSSGGALGKLMIYQDTSNPVLGTRLRMGYVDSTDNVVLGKIAFNVAIDYQPVGHPAAQPVAHNISLNTTGALDLVNSNVFNLIHEKFKTPAQMIVGTRLKNFIDSYNKLFDTAIGTAVVGDTQVSLVSNCGTEVITSAYMIAFNHANNSMAIEYLHSKVVMTTLNLAALSARQSAILATVAAFDHAPVIGIAYNTSGANNTYFLNQDYNILVYLTDTQLKEMNKVALQSQLALPIVQNPGK